MLQNAMEGCDSICLLSIILEGITADQSYSIHEKEEKNELYITA